MPVLHSRCLALYRSTTPATDATWTRSYGPSRWVNAGGLYQLHRLHQYRKVYCEHETLTMTTMTRKYCIRCENIFIRAHVAELSLHPFVTSDSDIFRVPAHTKLSPTSNLSCLSQSSAMSALTIVASSKSMLPSLVICVQSGATEGRWTQR